MKTIEDIFADNLKRIRKERGLNQEDFAEFLKIPPVSYQRYENGTVPQGPNMQALLKNLGLTESDLFADREKYVPRSAIEIQDGLTELFEKFPKLDHAGRLRVLNAIREQFAKIEPQSKRKIGSEG